jgi:hypothetical protein
MKTLAQTCMDHSNKSSKARRLLLMFFFTKYTSQFHIKTPISIHPRDETLTLDFKMPQEDQETLVTPRERERPSTNEDIRMSHHQCLLH